MLQQNGITSIPFGISFNKLRELRLDRNQLVSVEPLSTCSNLRKLNISWNNIKTFEVNFISLLTFLIFNFFRVFQVFKTFKRFQQVIIQLHP